MAGFVLLQVQSSRSRRNWSRPGLSGGRPGLRWHRAHWFDSEGVRVSGEQGGGVGIGAWCVRSAVVLCACVRSLHVVAVAQTSIRHNKLFNPIARKTRSGLTVALCGKEPQQSLSGLGVELRMVRSLESIAGFSTRYRTSSPSSDERDRITEQMDAYDRQVKETQEQLERSAQQQERTANLLDRQERLYAEQERLQRRFAATAVLRVHSGEHGECAARRRCRRG
jgi:hypothetical protein